MPEVDRYDLTAIIAKLREAEKASTMQEMETPLAEAMVLLDAILEPEIEPQRCSVCGVAEDQADMYGLIDVTVLVHDGEEGHAWVKQLLCSSHAPAVLQSIYSAGFKDHRHGTTNHLEDHDCPGFNQPEECPTPDGEHNARDAYREPVLVMPKENGVAH